MKNKSIYSFVYIYFLFLLFTITSNPLLGQIVVIDAGHGYNPDCSNGDGRTETEINTNYAVSIKLNDLLDFYEVYLTRPTNGCGSWISVNERALLSNGWEADLFLSIHCNAGGGTGTETFWCESNDSDINPDIDFAEDIQYYMYTYGEWVDRRVVEDNSYLGYHLGVLSQSNATGCLNEIGFVDNTNDAAKLLDDDWRDEFAYAYYLSIQYAPVGIEDYIWIYDYNPGIPFVINQISYGRLEANFIDNWPYGDYITEWGKWKVNAISTCGEILVYEASTGNPSAYINIPPLQNGYNWLRDGNGNVLAKAIASGIDNTGHYHQAEYDITISGVPNTFITSGTLTSDTYWCGNIIITGNITVPNGITLTIVPGSYIAFPNGSSLIVNGSLNAIGNEDETISFASQSGTSPNSWGSISISGSGASGSSIQYANIFYGTRIEAINTSNITIQNCNIFNTYDGIRFYGSTGSIKNNIITTNSAGHGIIVEENSTATCDQNIVTKTSPTKTGVGILFRGGAGGTLWQNDINGWDWGVGAIWGSSPHFCNNPWGPQYRNNRIINSTTGVRIYSSSWPVLGAPQSGYGYNSIYDNSYKRIYFTSGGTLGALSNYWGGTPNSSMFYLGSGCSINYSYWLSSNPWTGFRPVNLDNKETALAEVVDEIPLTGNFVLLNGVNLRMKNQYIEAMNFFISYITEHPEDQAAYVELYNCYNEETANNIITFFISLPSLAAKEHKLLLSYLYLKEGNYLLAKIINNSIILTNPNTQLSTRAKINKVYIALYNENNFAEAIAIFNDVLQNSTLSSPLELSLVQQALESYAQIHGINYNGVMLPKENLTKTNEIELPKEFSLLGNYPNPFNPSTTISYALPFQSSVALVIYDIMGREIKSFSVPSQSSGYQNIIWDGTNENGNSVASGIYLYRISIKSLENNEDFVKSAKLMMLK